MPRITLDISDKALVALRNQLMGRVHEAYRTSHDLSRSAIESTCFCILKAANGEPVKVTVKGEGAK